MGEMMGEAIVVHKGDSVLGRALCGPYPAKFNTWTDVTCKRCLIFKTKTSKMERLELMKFYQSGRRAGKRPFGG